MVRKFEIGEAEREKLKFSGMYMGATGSGKTVGALITAKGIIKAMYPNLDPNGKEFWSKIGIVDTEHNRSKVYADTSVGGAYIGKFFHIEFEPPFDVDSYIGAIQALKDVGVEVVIVDSITHAWDDAGGILELHQNMGGQFSTWHKINPIIKKLYQAFTADDSIHIISTVRSKIKYEAAASETGKMKISKIGLKPVMRDDFEYEVLTALHFDEDHKVTVIKDNTHVFEDDVLLSDEYGVELHNFLDKGVDVFAARKAKGEKVVSEIVKLLDKNKDNKELIAIMSTVESQAKRKYGLVDWKELPTSSLQTIVERLRKEVDNA
jgi:hypothetical protein